MMRVALFWSSICSSAFGGSNRIGNFVALDDRRNASAELLPLWEALSPALRGGLGVHPTRKLGCNYIGFQSSPEFQNFVRCNDEQKQIVDMSIVGAELSTFLYCWCTLDMATYLSKYGCIDVRVCRPDCNAPEIQSCYQDCPAICFEHDYKTPGCNCSKPECIANAMCLIERAENDTAAGKLEHICDDAKVDSSEEAAEYDTCFNHVTHRTAWDRFVAQQYCFCGSNVSDMLSRNHCCGSVWGGPICAQQCQNIAACSTPEASKCIYDCRTLCSSITSNRVNMDCWNLCIREEGNCAQYTTCPPLPQVFPYVCEDGIDVQENGCCSTGKCPGSCGPRSNVYQFPGGWPNQCSCVDCPGPEDTEDVNEIEAGTTTLPKATLDAQDYYYYYYSYNDTNGSLDMPLETVIVLFGNVSLNVANPAAFAESAVAKDGIAFALAAHVQVDPSMVSVTLSVESMRRLSTQQRHLLPVVVATYKVSMPEALQSDAVRAKALLSALSGSNASAKDVLASEITNALATKAVLAGVADPESNVQIVSASKVKVVWMDVQSSATTTQFRVIEVGVDGFANRDPSDGNDDTKLLPFVGAMIYPSESSFPVGGTEVSIPDFIGSVFPGLEPMITNGLPGASALTINAPANVSTNGLIGIAFGVMVVILLGIATCVAFYMLWRRRVERERKRTLEQSNDTSDMDASVGTVVGRPIVVDEANSAYSENPKGKHSQHYVPPQIVQNVLAGQFHTNQSAPLPRESGDTSGQGLQQPPSGPPTGAASVPNASASASSGTSEFGGSACSSDSGEPDDEYPYAGGASSSSGCADVASFNAPIAAPSSNCTSADAEHTGARRSSGQQKQSSKNRSLRGAASTGTTSPVGEGPGQLSKGQHRSSPAAASAPVSSSGGHAPDAEGVAVGDTPEWSCERPGYRSIVL